MFKRLGLVLLVMCAVLLGASSVYAQEEKEIGCATRLLDCYKEAAQIDSFWYRWAAGIDCELDFVECARIKLLGT